VLARQPNRPEASAALVLPADQCVPAAPSADQIAVGDDVLAQPEVLPREREGIWPVTAEEHVLAAAGRPSMLGRVVVADSGGSLALAINPNRLVTGATAPAVVIMVSK
jgi:hypothetical protein